MHELHKKIPKQLKCLESEKVVTFSQYQTVKESSKKLNKQTGIEEEKISTKTKKVQHMMTYREIYQKLVKNRKQYLAHRYRLKNDKLHWPKILSTTGEYGKIFHMDFSENLQQMHIYEAQSCHFNKSQYSLHWIVVHGDAETQNFVFHLSDDKKHDGAFTKHVMEELTSLFSTAIVQVKSDNCSCQYKCGKVFHSSCALAKELQKKILVYYGVSRHGNGLVDGCHECIRYQKSLEEACHKGRF